VATGFKRGVDILSFEPRWLPIPGTLENYRAAIGKPHFLQDVANSVVVVVVTVLATGNNPPKPNTAPSLASRAVKIAIGVALLVIAIRRRRRMGQPKKPKKPPKWQATVDTMTPWFAMALAPVLQPWGLIAAGAATVVEAKLSSAQSYIALFLFCVLASASYLAIEIYAGFKPDQTLLIRFRSWIDSHTDQVIILGSFILGFWLIANSMYLIFT
jgi:hypothetical protein